MHSQKLIQAICFNDQSIPISDNNLMTRIVLLHRRYFGFGKVSAGSNSQSPYNGSGNAQDRKNISKLEPCNEKVKK